MTGYHLVQGAPGERPRGDAEAAARLRRRARHAERKLDDVRGRLDRARSNNAALRQKVAAAEKRVEKAKAAANRFPVDYDQDYRDIITAVRPFTMTGYDKLHALITAVKYVNRWAIPGDVVECGVWRGGSMHAAARAFDALGDHSRDFYLFDTFEGMPPPSAADVRWDGAAAANLLATQDRDTAVWAVATLDDVKKGFEGVPYPAEKIHYVQGKVEDTIPEHLPEQISILRLDTDWYESTAHELTHMYDRLAPGGVLMIDDYGHWAGSRTATDEFIERTGAKLLLIRMNTGRVAVKPWA